MTEHINWMIVRNNNAFLVKKRNIKKPFSKEPNNLTNLSSFRYSGLVRKKTVGIESVKGQDKKGFVLVLKKKKKDHRPAKSLIRYEMKAGPRRSLYKLKRVLRRSRYRRDLAMAALRRASAVLRSQKALPVKKPRTKKTE